MSPHAWAGRHRHADEGITIVEVIVASAILLIVATSVFAAMAGSLRLQGTAKQRQTGEFWAGKLMERARNQNYEAIGLSDTSAQIAALIGSVPAGDTDNPDLLLRRDTSNCLQVNTGSSASPNWERLVLSDWYTSPDAATTCSTQTANPDFHLVHSGSTDDYTDPGTSLTFNGWVFVSWAPVDGQTGVYYKRVLVLVRHPSQNGATSRIVRLSSLFSLGYVPSPTSTAGATTTTVAPTTTTVAATTTTLPSGCTYKAGDSQAPAGTIGLAGGAGYSNQTTVDINNSVSDLPNGSGASGMGLMQFSNTSASGPWLPAGGTAYNGVYSGWPISSGDGLKQVWGRFTDCDDNAVVLTDTITLDQTRPPAPTLTATARNKNTIDLSWTTSVDPGTSASGTARYNVFRLDKGASTPLATTTGTSYSDNGLSPGTAYTYWVTAVDAAGNESNPESNHATATTN